MAINYPNLQDHFAAKGPKRILCMDGGGIRGILSLGFLLEIEDLLRKRHGNDPEFRLCHYFDLIAGTSTGSIIAALLAQGWTVAAIISLYKDLADKIFRKRWWDPRSGAIRPRYNPKILAQFLQENLGSDCTIGDQFKLKTGLLVVCKRIDSGSPWPISNNPHGFYYDGLGDPTVIANRDYKLWQVVRASTAAPTFFKPELIKIAAPTREQPGGVEGEFMDGGVSPHNNPALQALWLATLQGFGLQWPAGPEKLFIVSVGTGRLPENRNAGKLSLVQGITALQSLMDDCGDMVDGLMQGMGTCLHHPRVIDPELRSLSPHELVDQARFSYVRYDVKLYHDPPLGVAKPPSDGIHDNPLLQQLGLGDLELKAMQKMDNPKPKDLLLKLGHTAAGSRVESAHFPPSFDLKQSGDNRVASPLSLAAAKQKYVQREGNQVFALQLNLGIETLTYRRWGGLQSAQEGDWLVERDGRVHTVAADSFARTYRKIGPATYVKQAVVWAVPAATDGAITTLEGQTEYRAGDFLVWNDEAGTDGYAMTREAFHALYRPATVDDEHP